jgi:protein SCO1
MAGLRTFRLWLWIAIGGLALVALAGALLLRPGEADEFGEAQFALLDQTGQPVDETILKGHPSMLFFGFTHCPDVCPTTMAEMASWYAELGEAGDDLRGFFVSVDPERDTPAVLGDYVSWVSPRITGLTGDPAEVAKLAKAWGAFYEKVPLEGGDYTMSHTASVFLLDSQGKFQGTIAYGEDQATAVEKLRRLVGGA